MTVLKRAQRPADTLAEAAGLDSVADGDVAEPDLAHFLAYWRGLATAPARPRRADLDPVAIPRLLPQVMITKLTPDGREHVRLAGTHIVDHLGFDPTGSDLNAADEGSRFASFCRTLNRSMREAGKPVYAGGNHISGQGAARHVRQIVCPLSDSGGEIDAAVRCVRFDVADDATTPPNDAWTEHIAFVYALTPDPR